LFPARTQAYTKRNILGAWRVAGIEPWNPRRVLKPWLNAKPENLRLKIFSIPPTPRTAHKARSTTREALELVTRNSETSRSFGLLLGN
jgi:hypothetical protein